MDNQNPWAYFYGLCYECFVYFIVDEQPCLNDYEFCRCPKCNYRCECTKEMIDKAIERKKSEEETLASRSKNLKTNFSVGCLVEDQSCCICGTPKGTKCSHCYENAAEMLDTAREVNSMNLGELYNALNELAECENEKDELTARIAMRKEGVESLEEACIKNKHMDKE